VAIKKLYKKGFIRGDGDLGRLAKKLGIHKTNLCRLARSYKLTNPGRALNKNMRSSISAERRQWIKINGHPRGMLGKTHSDSTKAVLAETSKTYWGSLSKRDKTMISIRAMKTKIKRYGTGAHRRPHTTWKSGYREIGGIRKYYRSRWEANYARYLEFLKATTQIKAWFHEPKIFWFDKIRRGATNYTPDFEVHLHNGTVEYHEVKGWMDARSKTKIKRMAKYYPEIKLLIIDAPFIKSLNNTIGPMLKDWEMG
jgi:hypothetical protein